MRCEIPSDREMDPLRQLGSGRKGSEGETKASTCLRARLAIMKL
jgi:hypothetical protein